MNEGWDEGIDDWCIVGSFEGKLVNESEGGEEFTIEESFEGFWDGKFDGGSDEALKGFADGLLTPISSRAT